MKRPFLHIFISYILGIFFYNKFDLNMNLIKLTLLINIFLLIVLILFRKKKELWKFIGLISIFLIGIVITNKSMESSSISKLYDKEVKATGVVKEVFVKEEGYEKYILYVKNIKYKGKSYAVNEKIIWNIYGETEIYLGDRVLVDIKIQKPNTNTNPKLFNYRLYLQSNNIFATASSKEYNIKIISSDNLNQREKIVIKVKEKITTVLDASLNRENSSILKSIILGDDSFLDEDYINDFRKLGLSHILAVSGLHIGIIFGFTIYMLDLLKVHRRTSMIISIGIIWIYAGLIGFPPSVLRASLMFSFLTIGKITFKRHDSVNALAIAGFLMLIYRPSWIFSVGFQLSFVATLAILVFMNEMNKVIKIKNKKFKSSLVIILTAQIGVLPVSLYYFNEVQILSVISNLIIAPILTIGIVMGFLIILSSTISIKLGVLFGIIANIVLNTASVMTESLSKITSLNIWVRSPSNIEIIFYYLAIFILLGIIDVRKMSKNIQRSLYLNFFIVIIYSFVLQLSKEDIKVEFIDVGQGDSCLVRLKDKNLLIDTGGNIFGNFDIGENILLPYLRKTGVKTIDGVFVSHFDADHCKALLVLFGEIDLKNIFIGYKSPENHLYRQIINASKKHGVKVNIINKGDKLKLDSNNYIEVLEPSRNETKYEGENDNSSVFILKLYDRELLFTGDIEDKGENVLIENSKKRNVDILKVPHHGSKTSSKEEFIEHFSPKTAIIQVGKNNFGHPNKDVLERYYKNNTKVFRNDELGLITVNITRNKMEFDGYLNEKQTFLDYISDNRHMVIYFLYGYVVILMIKYSESKDKKL